MTARRLPLTTAFGTSSLEPYCEIFGFRVDEAIEHISGGKRLTRELEPHRDCVSTVRADTDSSTSRTRRERSLRRVLDHIVDEKDPVRLIIATQRRIVWHASST
jgi:hypothetical protein